MNAFLMVLAIGLAALDLTVFCAVKITEALPPTDIYTAQPIAAGPVAAAPLANAVPAIPPAIASAKHSSARRLAAKN